MDTVSVAQNGVRWTRAKGPATSYPADAAKPSQELAAAVRWDIPDDGREHSVAVAMDAHGTPIAWERVTSGTVDSCPLYPRDLYAWALTCPGVRFLGVAHNHPSGDTTPSGPDGTGTRLVAAAGQIIGIDLLWSLVVTHRNDTWAAIPITGKGGKEKTPPVPGGDDQGNPPPPPEDEDEGEDGEGKGEDEEEEEDEGEDEEGEEEGKGGEDEDEGSEEASGSVDVEGGIHAGGGATKEDLASALDRLIGGGKR